ncbi:MAG: hypothetical protein OXS30_12850 [Chloroflexota bacterium]|nr:hypothetical protein [Chloroflexota bacterium]
MNRLLGLLVVVVAGGAAAVGCVNGDGGSEDLSQTANEASADEAQTASEVDADEMQAVESDHQVEPIPPPDAVPLSPGTYVAISVGGGIHCGILASGDVACGGRYWQAGRRIPPGPYRFIEAGSQSACGVRADGEIRCWGTSPPSPVALHRGVEFIQLSFDSGRGCGIDKVGAVRCWGHEEDQENQPPDGVFRRVSASWVHRCAIAEDTRLVCWGGRFYGHGAPSGTGFIVSSLARDMVASWRATAE